MRLSSRQNANAESPDEVARLAQLPGTDKSDLIRRAVQALLAASDVDRAGVWIDEGDRDARSPRGLPVFRGMVSERGGDGTPSEWTRLSLEALPSLEPLNGGRTVQQELGGTADQLMLGALLELRRAVWAPVGARGRLRGVLLAGTRRKHGVLPLARMEAVSAELALAIDLEEERRLARQRQADLNVASRLLAELAANGPTDSIFTRMVDSCTETAPGGDGLEAVFAILRTRPEFAADSSRNSQQTLSSENAGLSVAPRSHSHACQAPRWQSGDAAWLHAMGNSPLSTIWQSAEGARDTIVVGSNSGLAWLRADVGRIVAIPLFVSREPAGTLIAGLRAGPVAQGGVERLELRGELAVTALAQRRCTAALSLERKRQRAILESDPAPKIVVETSGRIGLLSRGANELLGLSASDANCAEGAGGLPHRIFSELFQAPDQSKVEAWLQRGQAAPQQNHGLGDETHEARLRTGSAVLLRAIPFADAPGNALAAVALEPLASSANSPSPPHRSETQLHHVIE